MPKTTMASLKAELEIVKLALADLKIEIEVLRKETHTSIRMLEEDVENSDAEVNKFDTALFLGQLGIDVPISEETMENIHIQAVKNGWNVWIEGEYYKKNPRCSKLMGIIAEAARGKGHKTAFNKPPRGQAFLWISK